MQLKDKSLREIINEHLWWEDFEESPEDAARLLEGVEDTSKEVNKISFLNHQEEGSLLDESSFRKLDFYEIDFTDFARLGIAEGLLVDENEQQECGFDYRKDYGNLHLVIQDIGDVFALYLKDYGFSYMKPLGMGVFEYPTIEELLSLSEGDRGRYIKECVLSEIELNLWEDDFDLKKEMYDYYHDVPGVGSPLIKQKMDLNSLLSVQEAAAVLDVSSARVKKMIADRVLEGFKFEGKLLVSELSVTKRIKFIEEHGKPTRNKEKLVWAKPSKDCSESMDETNRNCKDQKGAGVNTKPSLELLPGEKNRDYIERQFKYLFSNNLIPPFEKKRLTGDEYGDYRIANFGFSRPLFIENHRQRIDENGHPRYYAKPICGRYYLCSEWYFNPAKSCYNLDRLQRWIARFN